MLLRAADALGAEARRLLTDAVARERRAAGLTADAGEDIARVLADLERFADAVVDRAEDEADDELEREAERHAERFAAALAAAIGVFIRQQLLREDVRAILQIRSLEFRRLAQALLAEVRTRIAAAAIARASVNIPGGGDVFEAAIRDAIAAARKRARRVARIEITRLNSQLNEYRQRQIGVKKYTWRTILDGRERPAHHVRNAKVFSWDKPPEGGHPGTEINCRCRALAILEN